MVSVIVFGTFSLLFLNVPTGLCQIDGCLHESFDNAALSGISSTCASFNRVSPWTFDTYDSANVELPETPTSNGLIVAHEEGQHCISNNHALNAVDGSEIQISYFASGVATIIIALSNVIDKSIVNSVFVPIVYDDWSTYSFALEAGELSLSILGGVANDSSLIVIDSVTYADARKDIHYCMYGVAAPEPDAAPTPEPTPEPTDEATEDAATGSTPALTTGDTAESAPETSPEETLEPTAPDSEPESRTLALSLSIVFTILFALVVGVACHCIQKRKTNPHRRI